MTEKQFVEMIGPLATADMQQSGILASVAVAQACLESGFGSTTLAINANNLFGMKCTLSGNTWESVWDGKSKYAKRTAEQLANGKEFFVTADFRKYPSITQSIRDHSLYLTQAKNGSNLRYAGLIGCKDYRAAAQLIKDGGYATDVKYVDKICSLIERWNLTQYDQRKGINMAININREFVSEQNISGKGNACRFIIIHETDNFNRGAGARTHAKSQHDGHFSGQSVHYYSGSDGVYQAAEHPCQCWHIGISYVSNPPVAGASNANAIGIEICVNPDGNYIKARQNAIELVRYLIQATGIPASRVIRHYDAKGKYCPRKMMDNPALWTDFKAQIGNPSTSTNPSTPTAVDKYYRVGKSWSNGVCQEQIGAYTSLANAKISCKAGYKVFDWTGKVVHETSTVSVPSGNVNVEAAQIALNRSFGAGLVVDGKWGAASQMAWNKALQITLNELYNAHLTIDGLIGINTKAAIRTVSYGTNNLLVGVLQIALYARGYATGGIDCGFGSATKKATEAYQKNAGLITDGIVGQNTFVSLSK